VTIEEDGSVPARAQIDPKNRWDLSPLFRDDGAWEKGLREVEKRIQPLEEHRGRIRNSVSGLARFIELVDDLSRSLENLSVYAHLRNDEDLSDTGAQAMKDRVQRTSVQFDTATSFLVPELLLSDEGFLGGLLQKEELSFARVPLRRILRNREHYLSREEERVIAMSSEALYSAPRTFSILNNADIRFPTIKDERGKDVEISHARFVGMLRSADRRYRKDAFFGLYGTYDSLKNTFCALLDGEFKRRWLICRLRRYPSMLEASLDDDEVDIDVYSNLIRTVRDNLVHLHRYLDLRRRVLGLSELHIYDVYVPLVGNLDREVPIEEARGIAKRALVPLGREVNEMVDRAFGGRWIDLYESRGKRSGAYSSGSYDSPPYMLMNYQNRVDDLFTLVHEMGHSIHSYLANHNQPHISADYRIFVAEVASTLNENLLMDHLRSSWTEPEEQAYLLNHLLEEIRGTIYRQTMFAEFEWEIAKRMESDEPFTRELLSNLYLELNRDYFGDGVVLDRGIELEWARIPHFYYDFYVYKYATGYSSALDIANRILEKGDGALVGYLDMLKAGGSRPPLDLLKIASVDLSTPEPIENALSLFGRTVNELEKVLKEGLGMDI